MDEKQLIKQILKGDAEAFRYFVDTYQNMAMTIAYRVCRNRTDAEDIVQNAFMSAYRGLSSFKKESKFSSWFYRIVYNLSINYVNKRNSRKENIGLESGEIGAAGGSESVQENYTKELNEEIDTALRKLPHSDAVIISLYYLEGYSVQEIARIVSLTPSNVKIKLFRARKALKDLLE